MAARLRQLYMALCRVRDKSLLAQHRYVPIGALEKWADMVEEFMSEFKQIAENVLAEAEYEHLVVLMVDMMMTYHEAVAYLSACTPPLCGGNRPQFTQLFGHSTSEARVRPQESIQGAMSRKERDLA